MSQSVASRIVPILQFGQIFIIKAIGILANQKGIISIQNGKKIRPAHPKHPVAAKEIKMPKDNLSCHLELLPKYPQSFLVQMYSFIFNFVV